MSDRKRTNVTMLVLAAVFAGLAVLEVAYFAADDTYRADGTSNWDAYPAARAYVVAATVAASAAALLAAGAALGRVRARFAIVLGAVAFGLAFASWAGTLN
jgi:hypothetical protein